MDDRPETPSGDSGGGAIETPASGAPVSVPSSPGVDPDTFRDALAEWAATVTVVAVRDGDDVHAVTVTSFLPASLEPPLVVVSLSPNARVLPFVETGTTVGITFLGESQRRVASVFADPFPVGPSPFPEHGAPLVQGGAVGLVCEVVRTIDLEGRTRLVIARVDRLEEGTGASPLLYHHREYRRLAEG